jgi:hypothetical protein
MLAPEPARQRQVVVVVVVVLMVVVVVVLLVRRWWCLDIDSSSTHRGRLRWSAPWLLWRAWRSVFASCTARLLQVTRDERSVKLAS